MALNDRKIKILQAIIHDYIATAEPVGSRTIAKKYDFGLSSATIRNEMSDLEEMGFIIQPHASAGRIPSDMGYRLYVDSLMQQRELVDNEKFVLQSIVEANVNQIEYLMEETARILSAATNYTTIISEPVSKNKNIKKIQVISLDEKTIMVIVISDGNIVKNHISRVEYLPEEKELFDISCAISEMLEGELMESINEKVIEKLYEDFSGYHEIVELVLKAIEKTAKESENLQFHLSGAKNILTFPEFSDVQKAKTLIQTLEEKEILQGLLSARPEQAGDIQIYIGNETGIDEMKDCSVITKNYKFADNIQGSIAILGPTRMNYSQVVSVLNGMVKNIEDVVARINSEKNNDS